VPKPPNKPVVG